MSDKVNDCNVWQPRPGDVSISKVGKGAPHIAVMSGILKVLHFSQDTNQ